MSTTRGRAQRSTDRSECGFRQIARRPGGVTSRKSDEFITGLLDGQGEGGVCYPSPSASRRHRQRRRPSEVNVHGRPADPAAPAASDNPGRLGLLLSAAMFVLVVDTSLMNVSISAVVHDPGTTVSGVQSAIALEALVSAAFILISSKLGDLFGRKLAYTLGLLAYAVGATAMVLPKTCGWSSSSGPSWAAWAPRCCCRRCSR